jgi:diguanylate cyclase (GGDEF)-like protein/PAS domain S-box-containing protein
MKIHLGFLGALLTLGVVGTVSCRSALHSTAKEAEIADKQQDIRGITEGLSALKDAETEERGYVITGQKDYLRTYADGVFEATRHNLLVPVPDQLVYLEKDKIAFMDQVIRTRQEHGFAAAQQLVAGGHGETMMNNLREMAQQQRFDILTHVNQGLADAEASEQKMLAIIVCGYLLASSVVLLSYLLIRRDISQRKRTEKELQQSEERFRSLIRNASDIIAVLDPTRCVQYVSPAAERLLGFSPELLQSKTFLTLIHADDNGTAHENFEQIQHHPNHHVTTEWRLQRRDGSWRHFEVILNNLLNEPGVQGIVVTLRDITERIGFEEKLTYQAFHDPLTDLPNRALFMDRLKGALARSRRNRSAAAVLFVDLDNFKVINDSLGHEAGDCLLTTIAERLQSCARQGDTVARLGGDEFTLLLEDLRDGEEAKRVAERILEQFLKPVNLCGRDVLGSASIGIAISTEATEEPEDLLRDADTAMYQAKTSGKAGYMLFHPNMNIEVMERLELEQDLRYALENGEFLLHYQPILSLETQQVREVEALLRWVHPTRGLISPAQFIPIAEETGLIVPIGKWVLEQACQQAKSWEQDDSARASLVIGVNVSAKQLQQADFVECVRAILARTQLDPARLKLEITESLVMVNLEATAAKLHELKQLGVSLAVDDFGTGYSSMAYLNSLPFDTLKIDRSFVQRLGQNAESVEVIRAIINLARSLNLQVTTEGIETQDQLCSLQAMGSHLGQGFYLSRPLTQTALTAFMESAFASHLSPTEGLSGTLPAGRRRAA